MNILEFWKENSGGNEEDRRERRAAKDQWKTPEMELESSQWCWRGWKDFQNV